MLTQFIIEKILADEFIAKELISWAKWRYARSSCWNRIINQYSIESKWWSSPHTHIVKPSKFEHIVPKPKFLASGDTISLEFKHNSSII
jgi:hypothetical protein